MGLDAFDICLRLEREFGLRKVSRAWPTTGQRYDGRPDLTAADVARLVTGLLGRTPSAGAGPVSPAPDDGRLSYESRVGEPWPPVATFDPTVWPGVCRVLSAALGVPASEIVPQSRLIRDLGMS